jgi:protein involved in polysaccharide export with SLBB domain
VTVTGSWRAPVIAGVASLWWAALSPLAAQARPDADIPRLQPGDRVLITVWRKPELSGESVVTADSVLSHPLYQSIKVVGVPLPQVKERLLAFLAQYERDPLLTVEPLFRVTVGGEVRQPNVYSLARSATVAQAIAGAGGPTDRGKLTKVRLYRAGKQIHLDLNDPRSDQANMPIRSGDNIIVGRGHNFFRDVLAPGASLTAAILSIVVIVRQ